MQWRSRQAGTRSQVGDELEITIGQTIFVVSVLGMAEQRRPAPEARLLYQETAESEARRLRVIDRRKGATEDRRNGATFC